MLIKVGYEFVFQVETPSLMLLMVALHPDREHTVRRHSGMLIEPYIPIEEFSDVYGNRCRRILAPAGPLRLWDDMVVEDSGHPDPVVPWARQLPAQELPSETLLFLLSSRYCEVDRLMEVAWALFARRRKAGGGSRPSATGCTPTSASTTRQPAPRRRPTTSSWSGPASAATSRTWP